MPRPTAPGESTAKGSRGLPQSGTTALIDSRFSIFDSRPLRMWAHDAADAGFRAQLRAQLVGFGTAEHRAHAYAGERTLVAVDRFGESGEAGSAQAIAQFPGFGGVAEGADLYCEPGPGSCRRGRRR